MSATRVEQTVCGDCGRAVDLYGGQSARHGLRYWAAYRCEHCGGQLEMDGIGMPPESFRQALLREEGTWGLDVQALGAHVVLALKCLRAELGLTLADASALKARIPGVVREGTRVEMEWLRKLLGANGVTSSVVRAGLDGSESGEPVP
ncbi:hypothetical protein D7X30_40905 [Corallococcus sp. AB011P]|uniref:hypothetical protein n=1 Tax=unclassified Corallococcus TaxID=2685029 RepID=UPI000EA2692F|nr:MULTISPECIES: hypothetical protein [unclassified Corallococcus]RKG48285.1 hypothetical protein D7X30_40905 [Corallococcus sp. AB011P]RKH79019.1 hypothetical protein D7Y21_34685 [Corallococcus sp. AB045]